MSMTPKLRGLLERERQSCRETADALDQIVAAACGDDALYDRLNEVVDGKAIRVLVVAAVKLSGQAAVIEFNLAHEDAS